MGACGERVSLKDGPCMEDSSPQLQPQWGCDLLLCGALSFGTRVLQPSARSG